MDAVTIVCSRCAEERQEAKPDMRLALECTGMLCMGMYIRLRSVLAYEQSARGTVVGGILRGIDWYLNCIHTMKPR